MARVPTIAEEDAKRPNRERDCLVGERTRIVNRIKSTLARLGHSQLQSNPAQGRRAKFGDNSRYPVPYSRHRDDPFCNWIALIKPPFLDAGESTFEGWGNAVDTNAEGPAYGWG